MDSGKKDHLTDSLKILVVDTYYEDFLKTFHAERRDLATASYDDTLAALMAQCFGTADYYSRNLLALGDTCVDVVANDRLLQAKWAAEHGLPFDATPPLEAVMRQIPYARRFARHSDWRLPALVDRIRAESPDVVYFQNLSLLEPWFADAIRPFAKLIVGQIACPPPSERYLRGFDLILTSFPHFVRRFRALGIGSEYFRIAFETTLLDRLVTLPEAYDAVFVGGFVDVHAQATVALERLASEVQLDVWGYGTESLAPDSPLRTHFHGQAWGIDVYNIFHNSKIVVNRHSSAAENYANNMRLFEATGSGAMLITDEKDNLDELFEVGIEVVSYRDADDLIDKVRYYLTHDDERAAIAAAGQARTLREHTYANRMKELHGILTRYLR